MHFLHAFIVFECASHVIIHCKCVLSIEKLFMRCEHWVKDVSVLFCKSKIVGNSIFGALASLRIVRNDLIEVLCFHQIMSMGDTPFLTKFSSARIPKPNTNSRAITRTKSIPLHLPCHSMCLSQLFIEHKLHTSFIKTIQSKYTFRVFCQSVYVHLADNVICSVVNNGLSNQVEVCSKG